MVSTVLVCRAGFQDLFAWSQEARVPGGNSGTQGNKLFVLNGRIRVHCTVAYTFNNYFLFFLVNVFLYKNLVSFMRVIYSPRCHSMASVTNEGLSCEYGAVLEYR